MKKTEKKKLIAKKRRLTRLLKCFNDKKEYCYSMGAELIAIRIEILDKQIKL